MIHRLSIERILFGYISAGLAALLMTGCVGDAGVKQSLPQSQGADNFGAQTRTATYGVTVTASDSASVSIRIDGGATDYSQQGEATQAQTGGTTGAVDNKPEVEGDEVSLPVPGL